MQTLQTLLSHWQGAVAVVLVLGGLIFFHELGHFLFARLFGMGVRTFSLGFGPRLVSRRIGKTDYCISAVPLGGYVALVGQGGLEEDLEADPADAREFTDQEQFFKRPAWQRMVVIAAGPIANFVLAWLIYFGLAFTHGATYQLPDIGNVVADSPAAQAGLQPDDTILRIDGRPLVRWTQLSEAVAASEGAPLEMTILRDGQELTVHVVPAPADRTTIFGETEQTWLIGIMSKGTMGHTPLGLGAAAVEGARQTWHMVSFTVEGIVKLVQRIVPFDAVGGSILIAQAVGEEAQKGLVQVLLVAALISVNLGLLNLLPIPVLDGGHIFFLFFEMLLGRPVNMAIQEVSARVGVVMLIGLMLFATWNDLVRLFS